VKSALLRFAKFSNHSQAVDGGFPLVITTATWKL